MTAHACGVFDQVKRAGCCCCCAEPVYAVLEVMTDGPLTGHPRRLGPQLDAGTQVEFLLSDGSEADVSFCLVCAAHLTPADYQKVWECVIDRALLAFRVAGRAATEQRMAVESYRRIFPIAVVRWRREGREINRLVVDRRRPAAAHA